MKPETIHLKKVRVKWRKLGKEGWPDGQVYRDRGYNILEIDPRQTEKSLINTQIHEIEVRNGQK